jgi:hypothetical protein
MCLTMFNRATNQSVRARTQNGHRSTKVLGSRRSDKLARQNLRLARTKWGKLTPESLQTLKTFSELGFSIVAGDLLFLNSRWYVTHTGLVRLARRKHCAGIDVKPLAAFCNSQGSRWVFKATVFKSNFCLGFVGYGDADPSNVSSLVQGAELRVAETRAVNRALRKAYGIGSCSVEEIGSLDRQPRSDAEFKQTAQPANGNGNFGGRTVRDRLCQLIRQHQLDATSVKLYATEFCGVKALRDATREQVEKFVAHLAEEAEKDRSALLCQLDSYGNSKAGAA